MNLIFVRWPRWTLRRKKFAAFIAQIFPQGIEQLRGKSSAGIAVSLHR